MAFTQCTVQLHDTIFTVATRFGISPADLLAANPQIDKQTRALATGQNLKVPNASSIGGRKKTHMVQAHETLASIAAVLRVSQRDLLKENPEIDPITHALTAGQVLGIPDAPDPLYQYPVWLDVAVAEAIQTGRGAEFYRAGTGLGGENWCSIFVNWAMREVHLEGTGNAMAMSWLDWGQPLSAPKPGAVAICSDGDYHVPGYEGIPWYHVTIFKGGESCSFRGVGGNQCGDIGYPCVCGSNYGPPKMIEAQFRWPTKLAYL